MENLNDDHPKSAQSGPRSVVGIATGYRVA